MIFFLDLESIFKMFKILEYIISNPYCQAPEIRDFLGIIHLSNPNKEEKEFYKLLSKLNNDGYISKVPIKKKGSGGAQFNLIILKTGAELLSRLKDFFSKKLEDKGQYPDLKAKQIVLGSMLRVFSSESVDVIEDLVRDLLGESFNDASYKIQQEIIDKINKSVEKIRDKALEITKSFF